MNKMYKFVDSAEENDFYLGVFLGRTAAERYLAREQGKKLEKCFYWIERLPRHPEAYCDGYMKELKLELCARLRNPFTAKAHCRGFEHGFYTFLNGFKREKVSTYAELEDKVVLQTLIEDVEDDIEDNAGEEWKK